MAPLPMTNVTSQGAPTPPQRAATDTAQTRELTSEEQAYVAAARQHAFLRYEGKLVPHRSCGIAVAETFGLPTRPYQALRRGGITGDGPCGAIRAGEHVLGELLGDADPAGAVTAALRAAVVWYAQTWRSRILPTHTDIVCNNLVRPLGEFTGPHRAAFCTNLAAEVAAATAEALCRFAPDAQSRPPICLVVASIVK